MRLAENTFQTSSATIHAAEIGMTDTYCGRPILKAWKLVKRRKVTCKQCLAHRKMMVKGPKHGVRSTYLSLRCHCQLCKAANAEYQREKRAERWFANNSPQGKDQK